MNSEFLVNVDCMVVLSEWKKLDSEINLTFYQIKYSI